MTLACRVVSPGRIDQTHVMQADNVSQTIDLDYVDTTPRVVRRWKFWRWSGVDADAGRKIGG